ncbi:MAG: hypothetical protein AB8C84_03465 [Oligoflexales bacterium]
MVKWIYVFCSTLMISVAMYGDVVVRLGPPALGGGGANPLTIPPLSLQDYEITWISSKNREWNFSISPGFTYGYRTSDLGMYASFGGGLMINKNGVSPGVYSAVGYTNPCKKYCFHIEYKQAIGILGTMIHPYAVRMGIQFR